MGVCVGGRAVRLGGVGDRTIRVGVFISTACVIMVGCTAVFVFYIFHF